MASSLPAPDEVALVVGGGTGIGRAIALELARRGAAVGVCGRRPDPLESVVAEIVAGGGVAHATPADVTDGLAMDAAVDAVERALGDISVLVVSTVGPPPEQASWLEWSDSDWRREVEVGALACFVLAQRVSPGMERHGYGRIIFIGSVLGTLGIDPYVYRTPETPEGMTAVPYHAAKGAIIATARALACALAPSGVTVNVVSPGMVDTEGVAALLPAEIRTRIQERTPMGRLGTPGEIAAAVAFLASREAGFVTGHDLIVDGGWSAW